MALSKTENYKKDELKLLQGLNLELKILKTQQRIIEWVDHYGVDGVYVSFSGGKDSTVLLDIARKLYPEIKAVYCDTGLEYPEVKEFVKWQNGVEIIRPKKNFKQVLEEYGYPVISKENSQRLNIIKRGTVSEKRIEFYTNKLPKKYRYLIDAPFEISDNCCNVMKKQPFKRYEKETGRNAIIGTMAEESMLRKTQWYEYGCNAFECNRPISKPISFWTEQDILEYIQNNALAIPEVYGDIIKENGKYKTTKCDRTGCCYCLFGIQNEKRENRIQRLKKTHPEIHKYCMENLGIKEVLDYIGVESE